MDDDLKDLYVLRKLQPDGTYYYNKGTGNFATPKLYRLSGARNAVTVDIRDEERRIAHNSRIPGWKERPGYVFHPWEIVPVEIVLGPETK
jgi:hypothetical protein